MSDVARRNLVNALAAYYGGDALALVAQAVSSRISDLRALPEPKESVEPQVEWLLDFGLLLAQTALARRQPPAEDRLGTLVVRG